MAMIVMSTGADVFVPFPEEKEAKDYLHSTENPVVLQCDEKHQSAGEVLVFPGPLLRADMQKDKLVRFIQQKCQECLLHLEDPQQQKSFFFWSIMECFCKRNGSVMMAEIAALLFSGYSLLRKKLGRMKNQEQWCLPLAKLLCSALPDDQLREEIIKMGQDFASRKWLYAAHICFVLAQVELESYENFKLIGCDSFQQEKPDLMETLERTEVYEYVLSLTSGFGQIHFQYYKIFYAYELFELGRSAQALQYCEAIAAELIRCPSLVDTDVIKTLCLLSNSLLGGIEEPEWLEKLQSQEDAPPQFHPSEHSEVDSLYTISELLGRGGFGSVYAGVRKTDGKQVAIKCVAKDLSETYITIPGETRSFPVEVALMVMVSKPPCETVVELLEWFETSKYFILVMERPESCMDLYKFCRDQGGTLSELESRFIMKQVVQAARHCCECGVLHRDIKPENILINTSTLEIKLIDFGCGELLKDEVYTKYIGTPVYFPPEVILHSEYHGVPATIWSLGVILYEMVCGFAPFDTSEEIAEGKLIYPSGLSGECCMLISWCLEHDPKNRPTFEEILDHKWFSLDN